MQKKLGQLRIQYEQAWAIARGGLFLSARTRDKWPLAHEMRGGRFVFAETQETTATPTVWKAAAHQAIAASRQWSWPVPQEQATSWPLLFLGNTCRCFFYLSPSGSGGQG